AGRADRADGRERPLAHDMGCGERGVGEGLIHSLLGGVLPHTAPPPAGAPRLLRGGEENGKAAAKHPPCQRREENDCHAPRPERGKKGKTGAGPPSEAEKGMARRPLSTRPVRAGKRMTDTRPVRSGEEKGKAVADPPSEAGKRMARRPLRTRPVRGGEAEARVFFP